MDAEVHHQRARRAAAQENQSQRDGATTLGFQTFRRPRARSSRLVLLIGRQRDQHVVLGGGRNRTPASPAAPSPPRAKPVGYSASWSTRKPPRTASVISEANTSRRPNAKSSANRLGEGRRRLPVAHLLHHAGEKAGRRLAILLRSAKSRTAAKLPACPASSSRHNSQVLRCASISR